MGSGKDNGRGGLPIYLFERDHDKIGQLIDNQDLIFTVGSLDDPSFWLARDLALSSSHFVDRWRLNPDGSFSIKSVVEYPLLITVGVGEPGITVLRPAEREGVLVMSGSVDHRQAAELVLLLYASISLPGYICFDFADCRQVFSGGIIQPLIYWTSSQERGDRLLQFLKQHEGMIMSSQRHLCALGWPQGSMWSLEQLETWTGILCEVVNENSFLFVRDIETFRPNTAFEMWLFCVQEG
jgi:hypothetical protein